MNILIEKNLEDVQISLELFHSLTKKERAIAIVLFDITQARLYNNNKFDIKPRVETIAIKANCSPRTVKSFNQKFRTKFKDFIKIKRIIKHGKQYLNSYEFKKSFLQAMFLLKLTNNLYRPSYRQVFITEFAEKQHLTIKKLIGKNSKLPRTGNENCPAIITLFNNILEDNKVLSKKVSISKEIKEKAIENLEYIEFNMSSVKISLQQRRYCLNNYPLAVLKKAQDDLNWWKGKGNVPKNEFGIFHSRIKKHNLDRRYHVANFI